MTFDERLMNRIAASIVGKLPENEQRAQAVLDMASAMMKFRLPKPEPMEIPDNVVDLNSSDLAKGDGY